MEIRFEKVVPTENQIDELFLLLSDRKYSISHKTVPSKREHFDFVSHNPYIAWYLLYKDKSLIGCVYVQPDNSIGLNLGEPTEGDVLDVINFIKTNHQPLPSVKSLRRGEFFVNVPSENLNLIKIFNELNKSEIQRSFVI